MKLNNGTELTPELITQQLQKKGVEDAPVSNKEESPKEVTKVEEIKPVQQDEVVVEVDDKPVSSDMEPAELEQAATAKGWKPKGPKSAEEFLRAEPLYDEIKSRGKEIKELKATLDEVKAHMDKQQALGYEKALNELKQERNEAIQRGDVESVDEIEKEMKSQEAGLAPLADKDVTDPETSEFLSRNAEWINDPSYEAQQIREFAHKRDQELTQFNLDPKEHLKIIEKDLQKKFPTRFGGEEAAAVSAVASDSGPLRTARTKRVRFSDLNPEQKNACRHFEKRGIMKRDDYITQLVDIGEI